MKKIASLILMVLVCIGIYAQQTNAPGSHPGKILTQKYVAPQTNPQGCSNILIYSDDPFNDPDFADQALQNLGCSYTGFYDSDFSGFESALTSGSWDFVIFADDNWTPPSSTFNALLTYVQGGGKLIYHSWQTYSSLESELEVSVISANYSNVPVYRWNPSHPLFNNPNSIPDLISLESLTYGTYGYKVQPIGTGLGLAGFTTLATINECGFVLGNNNTTIYQGWMDADFGDSNSNGKKDQVELYENMITGLCGGFSEVPVSNWALFIGIGLILLFAVVRFRKMT